MHDTVVTLSSAQRKRLIQGYDDLFNLGDPWDFGVFAGAGALKSTASDRLTYLDANLHPEKYAAGAAPGSTLIEEPAEVAALHEVFTCLHKSHTRIIGAPASALIMDW